MTSRAGWLARGRKIVNECRQIIADAEAWNALHPTEEPIEPDPGGVLASIIENMERTIALQEALIPAPVPAMRTYDLVNPSDPIVFEAPLPVVAACAAVLVGDGRFIAKDAETGVQVGGLLMFGRDGFEKEYGPLEAAIDTNRPAICEALRTFRLKGPGGRSSVFDLVQHAHYLAGDRVGATP